MLNTELQCPCILYLRDRNWAGRRDEPLWKRQLHSEQGTLLQYVNDLLICSLPQEDSDGYARKVLYFLGEGEYGISPAKAQILSQEVKYLGHTINYPRKMGLDNGLLEGNSLNSDTPR